MEKKTVLVTGIGGNVGQGILRNILRTGYPIRIVGCNVTDFSAGNHLCDAFYKVPYAMEESYMERINTIVVAEDVDLIIPSTDYEVYYLALNKAKLKNKVIVSELRTAQTYLDKYISYEFHKEHGLPFAEAYLPKDYPTGKFDDIIVKPREGRGSRGIHINPDDLSRFDDSYMVQKLIKGKEITTAFYVNKSNELHGFITLERKLDNGATNECFVNRDYDKKLEQILIKMIAVNQFKGSANLQSIVDDQGNIVPFEINCRISGTNSIRSNFGFEDVKYTLEEYLYDLEPTKAQVTEGSAVRILMDVIYPRQRDLSKLKDNSFEHFIF
ncbi:ATP-grasp domain-containing protein [Sphingobacterium lumbrici]|uniref:ATP-grasp domain-containing protein n=1 Tax=Sphingobacterium lumbrici TaxID=2559600 RepID=UPI00112B2906|nr:ATP-grasp domain-containing protein [Sphingobacterium lumbrici]